MLDAVDSLSSLRAFVAAADMLSFKEAGRTLGISSSAIGKAVSKLETQLASTLFHRTTRQISLTEAGRLFLGRARRVILEIEAGEAELADLSGHPKGRLRISLPLSGSLFTPALLAFSAQYPKVELDLDYTDRLVDVVEEGFDAVVRTGESTDSRLLQRIVGKINWCLAASPEYLGRMGHPKTSTDLLRHVCLRQKLSSGRIVPWSLRSSPTLKVPESMVSSIIDPLLELVLNGAGIAAFPTFMVADAIQRGQLTTLLGNDFEYCSKLSILWPTSKFQGPKVRAFIDGVLENVRT